MNRLPASRQVRLLTQIRDGQVITDGDQHFIKSATANSPGRNVTDRVAALTRNGWVEQTSDGLALTGDGETSLADASAIAQATAVPASQRPRVAITRRPRGNRPYGSRSRVPDGRNVTCYTCYERQKADSEAGQDRYRPDPIVWFTNEGGREADREAEVALAWHILKHLTEDTQRG